ncbi:hypothetical protein HDK64DRAFT_261268 [Phyllosticta capitalensis]
MLARTLLSLAMGTFIVADQSTHRMRASCTEDRRGVFARSPQHRIGRLCHLVMKNLRKVPTKKAHCFLSLSRPILQSPRLRTTRLSSLRYLPPRNPTLLQKKKTS